MAIPSWLKQVAAVLYDDAGNRIKAGVANGIVVEGAVAAGTAASGNPVPMGGMDSNGTTRRQATILSGSPDGISAQEALIVIGEKYHYDTANTKFYRALSGSADAQAGVNIPAFGQVRYNGATYDRLRVPNVFKIIHAVAVTALTGTTLWTPASGKKFRLLGWRFSSSAAASLLFYDGAAGALTTKIMESELTAVGGVTAQEFALGVLSAAANNTLALDVSATSTITGMVWGVEE